MMELIILIILIILTLAYAITVFTIVHQQEKDFLNFQKDLFKSELKIKQSESQLKILKAHKNHTSNGE